MLPILSRTQAALGCFLARHLLDKDASIYMVDGTRTQFSKALTLDFLHGCLSGWIDTVYPHYLTEYTDLFLKSGRAPSSEFVEEYTELFLQYEKIMEQGQDLINAIEFILQTLATTAANISPYFSDHRMRELTVRIRFKCAQLTNLISRILDRRDRRYDLFMKDLNIGDSISIKRLTILAAIFLPLSLASGILSMQTRFVNLHLLLYDFLGVFLLVASFAVLVYFVVRVFTTLARRDYMKVSAKYEPWKFKWWGDEAEDDEINLGMDLFFKYAGALCVWAVTITSFIVGMVLDVTLGLKILGYGLAALIGICLPVIGLLCCWVVLFALRNKRRERKRMKGESSM